MSGTNPYKGIQILDDFATLKISKDNLVVFVEGAVEEFFDEIVEKLPPVLDELGVTYGIKKVPELRDDILVVAEGIPPKKGEDGKIELLFCKNQDRQEDCNCIDLKNLNTIPNVTKGEVIAKRIPPTKGKPGVDIFGKEVPAQPGEWKSFKLGDFVEIVNGDTLVATADGAIYTDEDGTISVKKEWTINGDVDFSTGHVEFYGDKLFIKGSVLGGFTVECTGDVIIEKNIEDEAIVLTGGDLIVKGIIRSKNTMVKTGRNLKCGVIEYARAFVGKDFIVENYMLNANCQVHGSVEVIMGKGLIAGGKAFMGGSLKVNTIGTPANVSTVIGAGLDPLLMLHYESHVKEQESLANRLEKVKEGLIKVKTLEKKKGKLDNNLILLKENLQKAALAITEELKKNKEKIKKLEEELGQMEHATITVIGTAYPNTILKINEASLTINHPIKNMIFFYKAGEIVAKHLN